MLKTRHKRQWTPRGIRPVWTTKLCYDFGYLYVAIEPLQGNLIAVFLPDMTPESHRAFLDQVADEIETAIALYQDQAGTHRAEEVISASHVHIRDIPKSLWKTVLIIVDSTICEYHHVCRF